MLDFDTRNQVFRGLMFGLAISAPIWVVIGILIYRCF